LQVKDRLHGCKPADILKKSYYYTTDEDDFDGEIVEPLEQKISPLCRKYARTPDAPLSVNEMRVLSDWCALSLTRSLYAARSIEVASDDLPPGERDCLPEDQHAMTLLARRSAFHKLRDEMRRTQLSFQFLNGPGEHSFYLTDYPAVATPFDGPESTKSPIKPLMVPLSHNVMLLMTPVHLAKEFLDAFKPTQALLTLMQCGWAQRLIYSGDLDALDFAIEVLSDRVPGLNAEMVERGKLPFFGFGETDEFRKMWAKSE
jgi:hypothetical protein